jgi:hypothetical protein
LKHESSGFPSSAGAEICTRAIIKITGQKKQWSTCYEQIQMHVAVPDKQVTLLFKNIQENHPRESIKKQNGFLCTLENSTML